MLGVRSTAEGADICSVPVLGSAAARMLNRLGYEPAISPDGQSMAFVNSAIGKLGTELWVSDIDGRSPRKLAAAEEYLGIRYPAWSSIEAALPCGRRAA